MAIMINHVFYVDDDLADGLTQSIEIPFPLVPGMELMLSPSAWWSQFIVDTAQWCVDRNEMVCWLKFTGIGDLVVNPGEVRDLLLKYGWTSTS